MTSNFENSRMTQRDVSKSKWSAVSYLAAAFLVACGVSDRKISEAAGSGSGAAGEGGTGGPHVAGADGRAQASGGRGASAGSTNAGGTISDSDAGTAGDTEAGGASGAGASAGGTSAGGGSSSSNAGTSPGGTDSMGGSAAGGRAAAASGAAGSNTAGAFAAGGSSANAGGNRGTGGAAAGGASASGSGCTGLLFCDDFESYDSGGPPSGKWRYVVSGDADIVVDNTMAFSGSRSVHFTGTVNQSAANIIAQDAPTFPISGDTVYLRMMMYINTYPATAGTHSRLMRIGTATNGADGTGYAFSAYNGVGIDHINSGMFRDTSLNLSDLDGKWVCWEWELDNTAGPPPGDTGQVMAYLWRDSVALPLTSTHDTLQWSPVAWQILEVGFQAYQADPVMSDFWIDDVAVDTKRIGCPTK